MVLNNLRKMCSVNVLLLLLSCLVAASSGSRSSPQVTCGSTIKLIHARQEVRLHSHDVNYGSGSGQQSVTGVKNSDDVNSYWVVRGPMDQPCTRGAAMHCGGRLSLLHLQTGRNLHSHLFHSPLTSNAEVSAFGEKGRGDTGDNWKLICSGKTWRRDNKVEFKHEDTGNYLYCGGQKYGRPIAGQYEIAAHHASSPDTHWKAAEGVFIKSTKK